MPSQTKTHLPRISSLSELKQGERGVLVWKYQSNPVLMRKVMRLRLIEFVERQRFQTAGMNGPADNGWQVSVVEKGIKGHIKLLASLSIGRPLTKPEDIENELVANPENRAPLRKLLTMHYPDAKGMSNPIQVVDSLMSIEDVVVASNTRGSGLGTELFRHAHAFAREINPSLGKRIAVNFVNLHSVHLFKSLRFYLHGLKYARIAQPQQFYGNPLHPMIIDLRKTSAEMEKIQSDAETILYRGLVRRTPALEHQSVDALRRRHNLSPMDWSKRPA